MPNSNPFSTRRLARSGLDLTVLGLGGTGPGGLFEPTARDASDAMLAAALSGEIGCANTAPFYGFGLSERILGDAFRGHDITVSTKVGRLLVPGAHPDPASFGWPEPLPFTPVFDYTHDGILRSFDDSLQRMGRDRIDILYIHDIGEMTHGADNARHLSDLRGGGLRALERLRDEGRIRAIGLGVNEVEISSGTAGRRRMGRLPSGGTLHFAGADRAGRPAAALCCRGHGSRLAAGRSIRASWWGAIPGTTPQLLPTSSHVSIRCAPWRGTMAFPSPRWRCNFHWGIRR